MKKENDVKDYGNVTEQWLVCWLDNLKEGEKPEKGCKSDVTANANICNYEFSYVVFFVCLSIPAACCTTPQGCCSLSSPRDGPAAVWQSDAALGPPAGHMQKLQLNLHKTT